MADDDEGGDLTPAEMRAWLKGETAEIQVAAKRRIMDATAFVEAYEQGQLTPEEADRKLSEYSRRWPGILAKDDALGRSIEEEAAKISGKRLGGGRDPRSP